MTTLYRFDITLTLQGPVLAKSSSPASFGLDAAVARDIRSGRPMIPGTLVEGRVRESLEQLGEGNPVTLFGRLTDPQNKSTHRSEKDDTNEPVRGKLLIGDLVARRARTPLANPATAASDSETEEELAGQSKTPPPVPSLSRVALDGTLGSAKGEMLRVIETPFLAGDKVEFTGAAEMFCDDDKAAGEVARLLRLGLLWQTQFGALRSTGFGKVLEAEVEFGPCQIESKASEITEKTLSLDLDIRPRGPLCVARHKIGDNLFESENFIPGNMLAGAVMQTAVELGIADQEFKGAFDKIRFRHAYPTTADKQRPRVLPLSTVKAGKPSADGKIDHVFDLAKEAKPCRVLTRQDSYLAPEFPVDWKEHGDVLGALGWARPASELRVRTAINSENRTAYRGEDGEGGKLFAWEMVHPFLGDKEKTPVVWRSRIDLAGIKDEDQLKAVGKTLAKALAHLSFVSKTKVRCEVEVSPVTETTAAPDLAHGETFALVLQTPAQLADPRFQDVEGVPKSGAISADDMFKLYAAVWSEPELSDGSLALSHHFAQQRLAGGNYLGIRFQKKNNRPYNPWLLTEAGSVFVFTVTDADKAKEKLADWLDTGLPLPEWAVSAFGDAWEHNPYRPANGFGEIAVHRPEFAVPTCEPITLADPILSATACTPQSFG